MVEFKADTIRKKRLANRIFPETTERPFIVVYPYGDIRYKIKNKRIFNSWNSFDDLSHHISELLGDETKGTSPHGLESSTRNAFRSRKGVMLLLHNEETISMGYRKLAREKSHTKNLDFLTMKNPPSEFL